MKTEQENTANAEVLEGLHLYFTWNGVEFITQHEACTFDEKGNYKTREMVELGGFTEDGLKFFADLERQRLKLIEALEEARGQFLECNCGDVDGRCFGNCTWAIANAALAPYEKKNPVEVDGESYRSEFRSFADGPSSIEPLRPSSGFDHDAITGPAELPEYLASEPIYDQLIAVLGELLSASHDVVDRESEAVREANTVLLNAVKAKGQKHTVWIVWGESLKESEPTRYDFDTQAELNAFLKGVDESQGWMDYAQFDNEADATQHINEWNALQEGSDDE